MKAWLRRHLWLCLVFIVLVAVGIVYAKPVYHRIKLWRAHQLVANMGEEMASGGWKNVERKILAAGQLAPGDETVMQAQARYLSARMHPMARDLWVRLISRYPLNGENWKGLFLTALKFKDPRLAALGLKGFREASPDKVQDAMRYEIQLLASVGRVQEAAPLARKWMDENEQDQDNSMLLIACELLLHSDSEEDREYAREQLVRRGEEQDVRALGALVILSNDQNLSSKQTEWLIQRLREHPESTLEHGYLATTLEISSLSKKQGGIRREKITDHWRRFAEGKPLPERVQIAKWLILRNDFTSCAAIITPEEAMIQRDAALVHLDVLGAQGKWEEVIRFLKQKECPLPESLRFLYQAKAAHEQGQKEFFDLYWQRAFAAAKQERISLSFLANYAETMGWLNEAEEVCRELTRLSDTAFIGWMGLYNLGLKNNKPQLMEEAIQVLQPRMEEAAKKGIPQKVQETE